MSNRTGVPKGLHAPLNKSKHSMLLPANIYLSSCIWVRPRAFAPLLDNIAWMNKIARAGKAGAAGTLRVGRDLS
jgi:hypothetical protein